MDLRQESTSRQAAVAGGQRVRTYPQNPESATIDRGEKVSLSRSGARRARPLLRRAEPTIVPHFKSGGTADKSGGTADALGLDSGAQMFFTCSILFDTAQMTHQF